jgi:hypothetical protein
VLGKIKIPKSRGLVQNWVDYCCYFILYCDKNFIGKLRESIPCPASFVSLISVPLSECSRVFLLVQKSKKEATLAKVFFYVTQKDGVTELCI